MPEFAKLNSSIGGDSLSLVIATNETPEKLKAWIADNEKFDTLGLLVYTVNTKDLPLTLLGPTIPVTFVLQRGQLLSNEHGIRGWGNADFIAALRRELRTPPPSQALR